MAVTLKYSEEADDSQYPKRKFELKSMFTCDDEGINDFAVYLSGERVQIEFTGSSVSDEYPDVVDVNITKDMDGILIEYLNSSRVIRHKIIVRDYAFDYLELRNIVRKD